MILIGSKTEQEFRKQLLHSHEYLFVRKSNQKVLDVLNAYFPNMKTAYIIDQVPEQGEDIYTILIDTDYIIRVEIERRNLTAEPIIQTIGLNDYKYGLSKVKQIKLAVAIDLAKRDLND